MIETSCNESGNLNQEYAELSDLELEAIAGGKGNRDREVASGGPAVISLPGRSSEPDTQPSPRPDAGTSSAPVMTGFMRRLRRR